MFSLGECLQIAISDVRSNAPEKIRYVYRVPINGMVTKTGKNDPRIEPMVDSAYTRPATDPDSVV